MKPFPLLYVAQHLLMGWEEDMGEDPRNVKGILKISTRRATIQQERAITIGFNSELRKKYKTWF